MEEIKDYLAEFQAKLKAPKNQFNPFGRYKFRSKEDILEALKPIINPEGFHVSINEEICLIGERYYIKAIATITNGKISYSANGYAREELILKGMQSMQITGATSSYAGKYALNNLLGIDDAKDADATNDHKDNETSKKEQSNNKTETKPKEDNVSVNEADKQWLNELDKDKQVTFEFKKALELLKSSDTDIVKLRKIYKVSKSVENRLLELSKTKEEQQIDVTPSNDLSPQEDDLPFLINKY